MRIARKFKRKNELEKKEYENDVKRNAIMLTRKVLSKADEKYHEDLKKQTRSATDVAILKTMAVAADVIYNNWAVLSKKETRVEKFVELYIAAISNFNAEGTEAQQKAEKIMAEKWGVRIDLKE